MPQSEFVASAIKCQHHILGELTREFGGIKRDGSDRILCRNGSAGAWHSPQIGYHLCQHA